MDKELILKSSAVGQTPPNAVKIHLRTRASGRPGRRAALLLSRKRNHFPLLGGLNEHSTRAITSMRWERKWGAYTKIWDGYDATSKMGRENRRHTINSRNVFSVSAVQTDYEGRAKNSPKSCSLRKSWTSLIRQNKIT